MQPLNSKLYFLYVLEPKSPGFLTKNCSKSSYICVFILSTKQHNWLLKSFHNSGIVGHRKLSDPSFNWIFNALSIGVHFTLSFWWTKFRLKCLLRKYFLQYKLQSRCFWVTFAHVLYRTSLGNCFWSYNFQAQFYMNF